LKKQMPLPRQFIAAASAIPQTVAEAGPRGANLRVFRSLP
jgi:hypothetical protein